MSLLEKLVGYTAEKVIDELLSDVPDEQVAAFLSAAAVRRANKAADAAEALKFGVVPMVTDDE